MKMTSSGRRPQNIESGIFQQPLIGSYSNFKLILRGGLKENSEEISSVALLSPACLAFSLILRPQTIGLSAEIF
jgi:hypothetical protein